MNVCSNESLTRMAKLLSTIEKEISLAYVKHEDISLWDQEALKIGNMEMTYKALSESSEVETTKPPLEENSFQRRTKRKLDQKRKRKPVPQMDNKQSYLQMAGVEDCLKDKLKGLYSMQPRN